MKSQKGFTLIELLTVVAIIGILAKISINSVVLYKSNAAYAVVQQTVHDVHGSAQLGTLDIDNLPAAVPLTSQSVAGPVSNPLAREYLKGFIVPSNTKLSVSYDPTCTLVSCVSGFAEVKHCNGKKYVQWLQYGDGSYLRVEDIAGAGCS
jgi:prepilin-type N-terminal cleavage/methylation domain-containing protein